MHVHGYTHRHTAISEAVCEVRQREFRSLKQSIQPGQGDKEIKQTHWSEVRGPGRLTACGLLPACRFSVILHTIVNVQPFQGDVQQTYTLLPTSFFIECL